MPACAGIRRTLMKLAICVACLGVLYADAALSQYREGLPVLDARPQPVPAPLDKTVPTFQTSYKSAGSPRIVLLWNREITDQFAAVSVDKEITNEIGSANTTGLDRTTAGPAGAATLRKSNSSHAANKVVTTVHTDETGPLRQASLPEWAVTQIERAFTDAMNRAGVRFVDRALSIRMEAAKDHRNGGDPKLIETDAIQKRADLLLEILLVPDRAATAGYAFDVRAKDLRRGTEVGSIYSKAAVRRDQPRGDWVAGPSGYEFRVRPLEVPPPSKVGEALAMDVMQMLSTAIRH